MVPLHIHYTEFSALRTQEAEGLNVINSHTTIYIITYDNADNTYTSFKGFQLAGIWQEKSEIIVTTDIKQKIVIIQLVVLQQFSYYLQIGITPTQLSHCATHCLWCYHISNNRYISH